MRIRIFQKTTKGWARGRALSKLHIGLTEYINLTSPETANHPEMTITGVTRHIKRRHNSARGAFLYGFPIWGFSFGRKGMSGKEFGSDYGLKRKKKTIRKRVGFARKRILLWYTKRIPVKESNQLRESDYD